MNICDINCFIGVPPQKLSFEIPSPDALLREMDDLKIEKAYVTSFQAVYGRFPKEQNRELSLQLKKHADRLRPCWVVHPNYFNDLWNEKEFIKEAKGENIRMIRMMPLGAFPLIPWCFTELMKGLAEAGIVIYIDLTPGKGLCHIPVSSAQLNDLANFSKAYSDSKIILFSQKLASRHFEIPKLLLECPNIYLDISSFQRWKGIELLCKTGLSEQLIFGGYMPYFDAGQFIVELTYANISRSEKEKIFYKNIENLIRER